MNGGIIAGHLSYYFKWVVQVDPADYRFNVLSALNGSFNGRIQGKDVTITYDSGATITGKTDADDLDITFGGRTTVFIQ